MSLQSIRNKLNGTAPDGLSELRQKLLNRQPESDKPKPTSYVPEETLPFGALGVDKNGMPYYGEGVKGWIRKTYGDLFDPAKALIDPDDADWERYGRIAEGFTGALEQKTNWSAWGEKVFGLSSREAGNILASTIGAATIRKQDVMAQVEAGEMTEGEAKWEGAKWVTQTGARLLKDSTQRGIWGALEILGLGDVAMRKIWTARMGIDELADKYGRADDMNAFWSTVNANSNLTGRDKDVLSALSSVVSTEGNLSPIGFIRDAASLLTGVVKGDVSAAQLAADFGKIMQRNWRGSNAIYSIATDQAVKDEFDRRVAMGEDAGMVAAELAKPGIEFAGSVLGDPTTYLGIGLTKPTVVKTPLKLFGRTVEWAGNIPRLQFQQIGRIPTFGELIGLKTGMNRLKAAADSHFFSYASEDLARTFGNAYKAGDDAEVARFIDDAVRKVVNPVDTAMGQGKKIVNVGTGDLTSGDVDVLKEAYKRQYSITSFTAQSKASMAAKNASLTIDMIMGGSRSLDETMETLRDMIKMQNAPSYEDRILAAKRLALKGSQAADGTVKGHGALFFSEAGLMTGDLLSRIENKLDDIFSKYGTDTVEFEQNLFKSLDDAFQEVYPSVDEMFAGWKARRAGEATLKQLDLAKRYDALPWHVKKISQIHAKTSKIAAVSTGYQVTAFMRFNPGYATRNIAGQGAGIALDMGLSRAVQTSIDALWKPFVSMLTGGKLDPNMAHIVSRVEQVKRLTGAAPKAMWDGIGMAEIKNVKGFNALTLAQLGERLTSADIYANSVFDTITTALRSGGVLNGEASVQALVDAGTLNDKQAKLLLKTLTDNYGDTNAAVQALRKTIQNGQVEDWRHIPLNDNLRGIFQKSGNLDEVHLLQENARTVDEFEQGVNEILERIYKTAKENAANEIPSVSSTLDDNMQDAVSEIQDAFNLGEVSEGEMTYVTKKAQAWENVRYHLEEASAKLRDELVIRSRDMRVPDQAFKDKLTAIHALSKRQYSEVRNVNAMVRKAIDAIRNGEPPASVWGTLRRGEIYDITKTFPDVDPLKLSPQQAVKNIWDSYFDFSATHWRNTNNGLYNDTMTTLDEWAKAVGTSIDELAQTHTDKSDPMFLLQKAYYEADILERFGNPILDKYTAAPAGTTLMDMVSRFDEVDANGKPFTKKRIFNTINAERKAQGLQPYATYADVPFSEAQNAMRSRMSSMASPAEVVRSVNKGLAKSEKVKKVKLTPQTDLDELPKPVLEKVQLLAKQMLNELTGGGVQKGAGGERLGSTNVEWWKGLSGQNKKRDAIEKALAKIAEGKDGNTANVQRMKEMIFDRLRYGDPLTGTPPDMYALQQIGADKTVMQGALDDFNEITKNNFTLDEAIEASMPADEAMARTMDMPFYNEAGQLIQPKRYARIQDIPEELMRASVAPERLPPPINREYITTARAWWENMDGFVDDAVAWKNQVKADWGKFSDTGALPDNLEEGIAAWKKTVDDRMRLVKDKAMVYAGHQRDFLLHDYQKTYGDVALAYLMPFSYWHTRTYAQWAQRLVDQPKWGSMYLAYKRKMEREHAGMPDWWRQNAGIQIPGLMKNPVYFNLEATLNPINGLTGVDFNDPYKRVDWLSRTVDDMNKMGPAWTAPLNWVVAMNLYRKGEDEAAKRWLGRFFPLTTQIKAGLTEAGADINLGPFVKHNEVDPFVNFANDGLDPYELNRVNRHLSALVEQEPDPEKRALLATQIVDAARTHSGPLWEQARKNAVLERAPGQFSSWLLGVGFKPRTEEDMKVDQFYSEYFKLIKLRDTMGTDEYREAWDGLRDKYQFADALIIGKKADPERDGAFAYNVLGRIPPGQMGDLFEQVGLSNEDINRFYENKGDFEGWSEGDQKRFIAAVVDLSAILQMPPSATKQEWREVKSSYNGMKEQIAGQLGDDIWNKVQAYYDLKNDARYKGNAYLHDHPEVSRALDMQTQMLATTPLLYKYYGSLNTLQSYYNGELRKELEAKYGQGIYEQYYAYLDAVDPVEKKKLHTATLKAFIKEKNAQKDPITRSIVEMASYLPDRPEVEFRADLENPTTAQQNLLNTLNQPLSVDPQMLWANASPALQELVTSYWQEGEKLPYPAITNLDYLGEQFGISGDEALQIMGISLTKP